MAYYKVLLRSLGRLMEATKSLSHTPNSGYVASTETDDSS
jgi:hypothetical protein